MATTFSNGYVGDLSEPTNYERLREVKRRYDPEYVFQLNHNIR